MNTKKSSGKTPPRYPPGDDPKITDARRLELASKARLTKSEAQELLADLFRIQRKDRWIIENSPMDASYRARSAGASFQVVLPKLQELVLRWTEFSQSQSHKAKLPRGRVEDDGRTLSEIIKTLARTLKDELGDWVPAGGLWSEFYSQLDRIGLNPGEIFDRDQKKNYIEYGFLGRRKRITFGTFANAISKARKTHA